MRVDIQPCEDNTQLEMLIHAGSTNHVFVVYVSPDCVIYVDEEKVRIEA